jgi:predicted Zn-dependent peptidase
MTMQLLEQGAAGLGSQQIAEAEERLGAEINAGNDSERSIVTLSALSPNLTPSLDLLADIVERPTFAPAEVDRIRVQTLTGLAQLMKDPQQVGGRVLPGALFGPTHPYGAPAGGDAKAIAKFGRDDLAGFQQRWLRPDNVKIFVVSDRPLSEVQAQLDSEFGHCVTWICPSGVLSRVGAYSPRNSRRHHIPVLRFSSIEVNQYCHNSARICCGGCCGNGLPAKSCSTSLSFESSRTSVLGTME